MNAQRDRIPDEVDAAKIEQARELLQSRSGGPTTVDSEFGDFLHSETSKVFCCSTLSVRKILCNWLFKGGMRQYGLKMAIQHCEHDSVVAAIHALVSELPGRKSAIALSPPVLHGLVDTIRKLISAHAD